MKKYSVLISSSLVFIFISALIAIAASPTHTTPLINTTLGTNTSNENITCYNQTTTNSDGDNVTNVFLWFKNNTSFDALYMPFDLNISNTSSGAIKDYSAYANNGRLGGGSSDRAPIWNDSCKIGGCFPAGYGVYSVTHVTALDVSTSLRGF